MDNNDEQRFARRLKRQDIYTAIEAERERQDEKWGGPEHDDEHTLNEWAKRIHDHAAAAAGIYASYETPDARARREFVEVAALAVAAIEALDRKTGKTE